LSLLHPEIKAPWIQPHLCVINAQVDPTGRVHWNRSPFEMGTGFCAIGVANATGSRYHFMCVEMRYKRGFFLSRRRFLLFCQKVRACCPSRLSKRPHHDLALESCCVKYAIQTFTMFSINRSYMLQLCQAPYPTKPAICVLRAHSSINSDPFVRAELSREAPASLQSTNS
jgi:hypothetical protein